MTDKFPPEFNESGQRSNCEECDEDLMIGDTVNPSLCAHCFSNLPESVRRVLLGGRQFAAVKGSFEWMEAHARNIRDAKGSEYTVGANNRLHNFDLCSEQLNIMPEDVLAVFAYKHWASIMSYCKDPNREMSEPIEDRIADMINYLLLLYLMVYRRRKE